MVGLLLHDDVVIVLSFILAMLPGVDTANRNSSASSDGDDESHKLDNILGDIRSGFIQKKSFGDTAFSVTKVKKVRLFGSSISCYVRNFS